MHIYRVNRLTRHEDAEGRVNRLTREFLGFVTARDNLDVGARTLAAFPGEKHLEVKVSATRAR